MKRMSTSPPVHDGGIVTVTESNFERYSNEDKPLFVDFWASWCGPCRVMEPVVDRLSKRYGGKVVFGKVNVDEEMNLSSKYQVFSIPTFMIFKKGKPADAVIGAVGESALDMLISKSLRGSSA
jgi:thioredoxin 1